MLAAIYLRVSTQDQKTFNQEHELRQSNMPWAVLASASSRTSPTGRLRFYRTP
jgi:DNA invertase Pin-like site-specific DNA recombinase